MDRSILIDALYINDSGGKILLDFLIQKLEKSDRKVFYLLDKRLEGQNIKIKAENKLVFLKASLYNRRLFYTTNRKLFSTVLCFGNLPPNIRLKAKVYTYFHQQLYILLPETASLKQRISFFLKRTVLKFFSVNTDYWLLQTDLIKTNFEKKFNIAPSKVLVYPFYPQFNAGFKAERKSLSYVYISNAPAHKNHIRLINAFCTFYDEYKLGTLTLTVSKEFPELLALIEEKITQKYPIRNLGFIERSELSKVYQESEYLIYPSLAESFGLGLVEAIENGCKVIGADLPYTFAVCTPSLTFNPFDEKSISQALSLSLKKNTIPSVAKVSNRIDELISLLG
ncbi:MULTISPECIES: glycosyltransferase [Chryseobacterium]|uniref:Glycosyltransferase involved in cell wall biosynthesis n=1 Tax=Chryseobacterium camelliae TaxID=1265445 RepID=A0ABU0TDH7_9FLAO|nr:MULTISPECIES: glycosyltransferase [Chryseobacterium]MDT3407084.1 glycosyltransferase involved in cell wall biosynthesis [Pseudacidovorax intermedius]MDQ1095125.1 glycosyltransferase involved in cell wall biosynthesis [Chryseobacterium camelliae]MDQ1099062.1 glycosyltransferase involved in cell wall biosynthesis [Chryseobacterium sp. SORGH_AS_1048]MDR6086412.1 glycosyltransferase involved in cell wall biosynthesis [Chryseobacterium sp. SORGH_AS_0909]MDR6130783.1 glycosyltransferase involved 